MMSWVQSKGKGGVFEVLQTQILVPFTIVVLEVIKSAMVACMLFPHIFLPDMSHWVMNIKQRMVLS